jgi:hypothetical protein
VGNLRLRSGEKTHRSIFSAGQLSSAPCSARHYLTTEGIYSGSRNQLLHELAPTYAANDMQYAVRIFYEVETRALVETVMGPQAEGKVEN